MHPSKNILERKINTKKLKPGLVASYDRKEESIRKEVRKVVK